MSEYSLFKLLNREDKFYWYNSYRKNI